MAPVFSKSRGTAQMSCEECWVTLAEDDRSAGRALVLAKTLRRVATTRKIAVVVCDEVSDDYRNKLQSIFDQCIKLCMPCKRNGAPLRFYVKVFCWSMPFVRKCVFLDYDTMVLKNCDELFDYPGTAALFNKDDILETSVLVFEPSYDDYSDLSNWLRSGKLHNIHGTLLDVQFGKWIMKRKRFSQLASKFNVEIDLKETATAWSCEDLGIVRFYDSHPSDFMDDNDAIDKMAIVEKALVKYWKDTFEQEVLPLMRNPEQNLNSQKTSQLVYPGIDQHILDGNKEPIAIIGMSCRFPMADNVGEYWDVLVNGKDCIRRVPEDRWPSVKDEDFRGIQAGFLKCPVDQFDGKFFNISPFELAHMDPQQRLLLEVTWEALEHSGINPQSLTGSNASVFVGSWLQDYRELIRNDQGAFNDFHRTYMGNSLGGTSGRLSFLLGLNGPNIASESGCSSSMVALYLAIESLRKRRSDIALAAGANLLLHPFQKRHMVNVVSPDGRCKTFDESADGFGRAEGVATLVLKRYSDALKAGDNVLALVRGCGISQEGTSRSFGTPTKEGQEIAMQAALEDANVYPEQVSYVEAHGTGTIIGDVTEMAAITSLYGKNNRDSTLLVASGKTNIGHTESCSGIAGIIKVILAMQHEIIPPHINLSTLNPHINLEDALVRIPTKMEKWERVKDQPRIAGISSFGITGTNAHVILQESPKYCVPKLVLDLEERPAHILTFSAKTESTLNDVLDSYLKYLEGKPDCSLADIAFTCNVGRAHFQYRTSIVAGSHQELCQKLVSSSSRKAHHAPENKPEVCFLFTGQGSQYIGMAKTLYYTSPVFRMHLDRCDKILRNNFELSIIPAMWPQEKNDLLQQSLYSQVSIFCLEYCLLKLWESWGIRPDAVIGHSLGEFAAAVAAEMISFEDALKLVTERSRLIQEKAPKGQMIVVKADKENVDSILHEFCQKYPALWLDYAAFNSVEQTVLAGSPESVESFASYIQSSGCNVKTHVIEASSAFHSRDMDYVLSDYRQVLSDVKLSAPTIKYISGVTGQILKDGELNAEYWIRHTREPVRFLQASKVAYEHGLRLFLEVGPQPVLCALTMANCGELGEAQTLLPSVRKTENEWNTLMNTLGSLYQLGFQINWSRFDQYYNRKKIHLPTYPFSRRKHWYEEKQGQQGIIFNTKSLHPLLGYHVPNATSNAIFQSSLELEKFAYLKDHSIGGHVVFPAAGFLEMSLSSGCFSATGKLELENPMSIENLTVEAPLEIVQSEICHIQTVVSKGENDDTSISIFTQRTLNSSAGESSTSSFKWVRQAVASFNPLQINYHLREETENLHEIQLRCRLQVDTAEFYKNFTTVGLEFGNSFKSLKKLCKNPNEKEILTEIQLQEQNTDYLVHPIVLDALIQTIMIGINRTSSGSLFVPLAIGKVVIFAKSQSQCYFAHSRWEDDQSPDSRCATLYDQDGNVIAFMEKVQMIETSAETIVKKLTTKDLNIPIYEEIWRPKMGPMKNRTDLQVLNGENLFSQQFANELATCHRQTEEHIKMVANRRKLVYCYILKAFYGLGWEPKSNQQLDVDTFMSQMNILPNQGKLIHRYFSILHEEGILDKNPWRVVAIPPPLGKVEEDIASCVDFIRNHPLETGDAKVTIGCGERLARFITGKESALSFLFPEDKTTEVCAETFYNESITVNAAHIALTSTVKKLMENYTSMPEDQRGVIRFLEIGAGTGSTSKRVLPIFDEFKAKFQYTYTDISPAFFIKARPSFETYGQKIQYKVLNVEQDALSQGFIPHHYDIVMASNVLHATKDLAESLRNVKSLLKEDGLLLMVETLQPIREYDVVFGLLDGFWRFDDYDIRPDYPCASGEMWKTVCQKEGYNHYNFFPCFGGQVGVVIAKTSFNHSNTLNIPLKSSALDAEGWWLVFSDTQVFPNHLEQRFTELRRKVIVVHRSNQYRFNSDTYQYHVRSDVKADFVNIFKMINELKLKIEGIGYFWGLDKEDDPLKMTTGFLFLAQILLSEFKGLPKFVLVTEGMMPVADQSVVSITPSTLWGMVRSFRTEHFNLHVRSIDLDPDEDDLQLKYSELFSEFWNDDLEFQIAYRQRSRHVCRLVQIKDFPSPLSLPNSERYSLKLPHTKNIADLRFCPNGKVALKGNEVDVEVRATGLNFRDVFVVLKPEKQFDSINCLGLEFSGVVVATGPDTKHIKVGDRVMGCKFCPSALPSHVQMDEDLLFKIPNGFTFCEAATIPAAFATAYYCLVMIARLSKNETVLIHAGSGGVGLFAIQVARAVGANIIATAGSRRKRAFLRNLGIEHVFHSRNTKYAKQIHSLTEGKGVHVILNSLTSPGFKEASISVCCTKGRFVEMSKLNIYTCEEMKEIRPDIEYSIVDLTTVTKDTWTSFWGAIDEYISQGLLQPIPYTRFEATQIREALTYMQKAKHIGKIIVGQAKMTMKECAFEPDLKLFSDSSTYLITGGLGGIGMELTKWMVKNGAKHIVLTSRRSPDESVKKVIKELQDQGNNIVAMSVDVGDYDQCVGLFKAMQDKSLNLPRLRGIFHCAGTLSDATYVNQSIESFQAAFQGKVYGAWNLHLLTKDYNLENFTMFSSMVSILGPQGLSNYCSANAYLDALCHYRNAMGLPGVAINWGQWAEVGAAKHIKMPAVKPFTPQQGLLALETILKTQKTQVAILQIDFQYVRRLTSNVGAYLEELHLTKGSQGVAFTVKMGNFWDDFNTCDTEEKRVGVIKSYVDTILRQILKFDDDEAIDENQNFSEMGMDSLMMLEMKNYLCLMLGKNITMNVSEMSELTTIKKLASHVLHLINKCETKGANDMPCQSTVESKPYNHFSKELRKIIEQDMILPETIQGKPDPNNNVPDIQTVLLTGVTGKLGPYMLDCLIKRKGIQKVYCLIRAKDEKSAKERLSRVLQEKDRSALPQTRFEPVVGDITDSLLGLPETTYRVLAETVDAVVHCAVKGNLMDPYIKPGETPGHTIRDVNVIGTRSVLEFAAKIKSKRVLHASTLLACHKVTKDELLFEDWCNPEDVFEMTNIGYPVSKFVSEILAKQANDRGIDVQVHRFPGLLGDAAGIFSFPNNHIYLRLLGFCKLGAMPFIPVPLQLLPVDFCAEASCQLFFNESALPGVYNLTNPKMTILQDFPQLAKEFGFTIDIVEYEEFHRRLSENEELAAVFPYREVDLEDGRFIDFTLSPVAMQCWSKNPDKFFISNKVMNLLPKFKDEVLNPIDILRRDMEYARNNGIFSKMKLT